MKNTATLAISSLFAVSCLHASERLNLLKYAFTLLLTLTSILAAERPNIIVIMSDDVSDGRNWANVSNTPFRQYKTDNHEGGIASPLIAHWPKGIKSANQLRHQPAHLIDIMPTVIELSGAKYPTSHAKHRIQPMEGLSLVPGFQSDRNLDRVLLWEHYGKAAIRKEQYKLVRLGREKPWELYEIDHDRSELHNLAGEQPERVSELQKLWESHAWRTRIYPAPGDGN